MFISTNKPPIPLPFKACPVSLSIINSTSASSVTSTSKVSSSPFISLNSTSSPFFLASFSSLVTKCIYVLSPNDTASLKGILNTVPLLVSPTTLITNCSVGPYILALPPINPVP